MEAVATLTKTSVAERGVSRHQMPLTFLRNNEKAVVLKVRGNDEMHHHLENLGFVPGSDIKVISHQGGNYIVEVKGTQVAIDKSVAQKIITG